MKKIFLLFVSVCSLAMMTSCITVKHGISASKFSDEVNAVNAAILSLGYHLTGTSSDEKNELYVSSVYHDNSTGYSNSELSNNYYWYDTYRFTDSASNTASYQIKYKSSKDRKGTYIVSGVSLVGCDCSTVSDYSKICGEDGITKSFSHIENDQDSFFYRYRHWVSSFFLLSVCTPVVLMMLP